MKRSLITALGVLALAVPAFVLAATTTYEGAIKADDGGGYVKFKFVKEPGQKNVKNFQWFNVRISCDEGNGFYGGSFLGHLPVSDDRFAGTMDNFKGGTIKVKGTFLDHGKAKGTIRATGNIASSVGEPATNCDTGKDHWKAEK